MNTAGVTIHKMQLSGDTRQKDALLHSLDNQHWLGENDQRIIFIRKISVSGYWWELAQKISQQSNDQVATMGNQKKYQDQHLAVFNNYAELAADVIRNLLAGQKPWYLVRWLQQEDLTDDPIAVLQHRIYELQAVIENIKRNNQLSILFSKIDTQQMQSLLFSLSSISSVISSLKLDSLIEVDESIMFSLPQSASNWIRQYLVGLLPDNVSQEKLSSILKVISCLSAWKFMPQLLGDVEGFFKWHGAVVQVYRAILHPTLTLPLARGGDRSDSALSRESSPSPLPRGRLGGGENLNSENILGELEIPEKNLPQFLIHYAGLFFLLNLLKSHPTLTLPLARGGNRSHSALSREYSSSPLPRGRLGGGEELGSKPGAREELRNTQEVEEPGTNLEQDEEPHTINPWITIHQLFKKIAKHFSFPFDQSIQNLLIEISQLTPEEFNENLLLESPIVDQWFSHLQQKLQKMNLWDADWLQLTARVEVEQAYVNFYLDNSTVNLDLRMAGLDVNPGWVPWLGRVIYFHYGDYSELRMNS